MLDYLKNNPRDISDLNKTFSEIRNIIENYYKRLIIHEQHHEFNNKLKLSVEW